MLVAGTYTTRPTISEESSKRSLRLFTNWQPPSGFTFKSHYAACDGTGGFFIAEVTAEGLLEASATFTPFFDFKFVPVMDIAAAVPLFQRVNSWRDSIK